MVKGAVLTQEALDKLLAWLNPDRDVAGEKYESIRQTLTRFFEWRRCLPADEHVDETIDRVARRIAGGEQVRTADPRRYFYGVAKHVYQERLKAPPRIHLLTEPPLVAGPEASFDLECVRDCLATLPTGSRELLERYYLGERDGLADSMGVTHNALRLRVFKEKQKLRGCVARCLDVANPSRSRRNEPKGHD
jgi:DNA-directed RNA polymerase specialized sigma24 family protein